MACRILFIFFGLLFSQISFAQSKLLGENCQMEVGSSQLSEVAIQSTNQHANTKPVVRLAYLIPKNRVAKPYAVANMQYAMKQIQKFYQDQMELNGFGKKTFTLELDAKGAPVVHTVKSQTFDDTYFWSDMWGRSLTEASKLGIGIWKRGETWVVITECHVMGQDGSISGGTALGGGFGSGDGGGVAMIGSNALALFSESNFTSNQAYAGQLNTDLGPLPLVKDKSFAWFEGTTFSSVTSSYLGALAHELGHAFGLPHDFRNDENFYGNMMGNGLRGIRGNFYPHAYEQNYTRLSYADALIVNRSHFFNQALNQSISPVEISSLQLQGGMMKIDYKISNANPLSSIHLQLNGDFVEERVLNGRTVVGSFLTPYLSENATNNYQVLVYDQQGNRTSQSKPIALTTVPNRMATPFIKVSPLQRLPQNLQVEYAASNSAEYQNKNLVYTWEQSNDRITYRKFGQNKKEVITNDFDKRFVRLKIKSDKDSVYSTSIFVVSSPHFDRDVDGVLDHLDLCLNTPVGSKVDTNGCADSQKDTDKDGLMDHVDDCPTIPNPSTPIIEIKNFIELSANNGASYAWYLNGKTIADQTTALIKATSSGSYTVMAFDSKGCKSKLSTAMSILITGNQVEEAFLPLVYPNPVHDKLQVKIPTNFLPNAKIKLFDLNGIPYLQRENLVEDCILDVQALPVGTYLLQILDSSETHTQSVKVSKQ
jgi:hypothetical protein